MHYFSTGQGLSLANELAAEGISAFTFDEAQKRLGKTKPATANLLRRMEKVGLIERVRRGHYATRPLGVLGTPAVAEDIALCVGAALNGLPHRIAYRTALYEHDLIVHPVRSIQVAAVRPVRTRTLSGLPLRIVIEPPGKLDVGRIPRGTSWLSDPHRAILDAAHRPSLVGGLEVLAEALAAAVPDLRSEILADYARSLGWAAALRRLGSLADALTLRSLQGALTPLKPISSDLDLEPGNSERTVWRDKRWRVRWPLTVDEVSAVIGQ